MFSSNRSDGFTSLIEDYQKSVTGFKRCMEVLALEPEIQERQPMHLMRAR
jgi:hypothetical protein